MAIGKPLLIGYARVSTEDQDLALQLDALKAAGVEEGRIFTEKASGARGTYRPALAGALKALRASDTLVVRDLTRLGRSLEELIQTMRLIEAKGCNLRILTMAIDTGTPGGRFIFHVFAALAEFERELIVERTRAGLAAAKARGRTGGRKPLAMSPEQVDEAVAMLKAGADARAVAAKFGVSKSTIYNRIAGEWASALAEGTAK